MSIGIKAKWIIAHDGQTHRLLRDGTIITQGKHITYVGKDTNQTADTWIDATHHTVIPGLICTHTHASTAPKDKSFIDDTGARHFYMSSLGENLTALGKSIKPQDHHTYSKYSIAELLKSGCTTILDIGMVDNLGPQKAVKIIDETGIRALQGPTISDGV